MATTTHSIPSGDIALAVHDGGAGFPVLMLHGMWCDHHLYDDVVDLVAGECRTICPDLRAHGASGTPARPWTVRDMAEDLVHVLDALAIDKALVVGHSLGGMAALHMALNHPSRLHGLVLLSTSAEAEKPERRTQLHLIAMSISLWGMNRWVADQAARTFFSPAFARRAPGKVRAWRRLVRATRRRALLQSLEAIRDRPSVRDQLDTVAMPALVMGTRDDPIADPEDSAAMARGLRNADLQLLPGGGHALPMEHPSALARALKQFMNERL